MDEHSKTVVIIDDTDVGGSLIAEIEIAFKNVHCFQDAKSSIEFITSNIDKTRIVVLLDLGFPRDEPDGHMILEQIRKISFLIPVIIFSARPENEEKFSDLINNKAFAYINKDASNEDIVAKIKEAFDSQTDVSAALEDWINIHAEEQKKKPYIFISNGKTLTLNDILKEIRSQSEIGKKFSKDLLKLTIDLISRNKESLKND